jgi:hypothetical protein
MPHSDTYGNRNSSGFSYTCSFTYGYTYAPNSDRNCDSDSHTDCNTNSHRNSHADGHASSNTNAENCSNPENTAYPAAAPVTSTYENTTDCSIRACPP